MLYVIYASLYKGRNLIIYHRVPVANYHEKVIDHYENPRYLD